MFSFGKRSKELLNNINLNKDIVLLANKALEETKQDFSIISGFRTTAEQYRLFTQGLSELDGINNKSAHMFGKAIDVVPYIKNKNSFDYKDKDILLAWYEVHRAFLRASRLLDIPIELGLTYNIGNKYDYPHIQLKN